jgi:hypothetical protein
MIWCKKTAPLTCARSVASDENNDDKVSRKVS